MSGGNSLSERVFRRNIILSAIGMVLIVAIGVYLKGLPGFLQAHEIGKTDAKVFQDSESGVAINGYDPVGYFVSKQPVKGKAEHQLEWNDAIWWFANAENRDAFQSDPEKYAPQYGGFCAYAASQGYLAKTVPEAWTIENDRLFLNYSLAVKDKFDANRSEYISQADENWPGILSAD